MTDLEYCGHVCMAARRIGIVAREIHGNIEWLDRGSGFVLRCRDQGDRQKTLRAACEELSKYLTRQPR